MVTSVDWASTAAEQLLARKNVTQLPIDPIAIAESDSIKVVPKSASAGVSGFLIRSGSNFGIAYATHIRSQGYQRFSIGHELGHYHLPGHIDAVIPNSETVHQSRAGYKSANRFEFEADEFASGLLMPSKLFRTALIRASDGLDGVLSLSALCGTSLTATAIRYAKLATLPVAVVVSKGDTIDYCFMSDELRNFKGLNWLRKGGKLPAGSASKEFSATRSNVSEGRREDSLTQMNDWFGVDYELEMSEEIVGLGNYGKTLTVLTCETFADELDDDDTTRRGAPWE